MGFFYRKMKYFLLVLLVCKFYAPTESLDLRNIGKSAVGVTKGVLEKIPDLIPSAEEIFQSGKNLIAGYPFEKVSFVSLSFFITERDVSAVNICNSLSMFIFQLDLQYYQFILFGCSINVNGKATKNTKHCKYEFRA